MYTYSGYQSINTLRTTNNGKNYKVHYQNIIYCIYNKDKHHMNKSIYINKHVN